jgi:type II secretory pathway predicted ATPase ExeA
MYLRVSPYLDLLEGISVALQINEGITKLSGREGVGKSAACRELASLLQTHGQQVLYFAEAPTSVTALHVAILDQLGIGNQGNFTKLLGSFLLAQSAERRLLYIIFDEAQDIDLQTFDSIRMLCNIQDERQALVKPIICGDSRLESKLADIGFRSLAQYVSQSFTLSPMTIEQLKDFYWAYWRERGMQVQPPSPTVVTNLFRESQGFPGRILARLELAFQRVLDRREGREPAESIVQQMPARPGLPKIRLALGLGLILLAAGSALYLLDGKTTVPATAPAAPVSESVAIGNMLQEEAPLTASQDSIPVAASEPGEDTVLAEAETRDTAQPTPDDDEAELSLAEPVVAEAEPAQLLAEIAVAEVAPVPTDTVTEEALETLLAAWTSAWQAKDFDGYFGHYAASFAPANGDSIEAWQQQRRNSIDRASDIRISWDSLDLQAQDASSITLQFWLHYSASNYADDTLKELVLFKTDAGLRIGNERNLLVERPQ